MKKNHRRIRAITIALISLAALVIYFNIIKDNSDQDMFYISQQQTALSSPVFSLSQEGTRGILSAGMVKRNNLEAVIVRTDGAVEFTQSQSKDKRIVTLDIKNSISLATYDTYQIKESDKVSEIRIDQVDDTSVRISIYLEEGGDYIAEFNEVNNEIIVYVDDIKKQSITYRTLNQRTKIVLNGLTEDNQYNLKYDGTHKLKLEILNKKMDIPKGKINVKDGIISTIEVKKKGKNTIFTINLESPIDINEIINPSGAALVLDIRPKERKQLPPLIVIDPGHGGSDPGQSGSAYNIEEEEVNLKISFALEEELKKLGYRTNILRTEDQFIYLHERPLMANELEADVFVSVHNNWFHDSQVRGVETYYYPNDEHRDNKTLAQFIQEEMLKVIDSPDRGIRTEPFVVIKHTKMPAALVEAVYLSNPQDEAQLTSKENIKKIGQSIAKGVQRYLEFLDEN